MLTIPEAMESMSSMQLMSDIIIVCCFLAYASHPWLASATASMAAHLIIT
jgi:hypothetical protein